MSRVPARPSTRPLRVHLAGALAALVAASLGLGGAGAPGMAQSAGDLAARQPRPAVEHSSVTTAVGSREPQASEPGGPAGAPMALRPEEAANIGAPGQTPDGGSIPALPESSDARSAEIAPQFVDDSEAGAPETHRAADDPAAPDPERERRAARLAERFPAHAEARQTDTPAGRRWALIVGVNAYQGGVTDTFGSTPDARALADVLDERGWRDDHVLVLTDAEATGEMIRAGIDWLAERADEHSTVVASFSGHLQHREGTTALWPTDHDYLWADEVGDRFAEVAADRMWLSFQGCHAQGLRTPRLHRDGRVITYSSKTVQKSYEDPDTGQSVQGHYLFTEGLAAGRGASDTDRPSVQQAFGWAAPRMLERTAERQTPQIWDGLDEPFRLAPAE